MKTIITVRKIPLEAVLEVLLEMRDQGIEHVNFECVLTPVKDLLHITEYKNVPSSKKQQFSLIDYELKQLEHIEFIKKIIDGHGKN